MGRSWLKYTDWVSEYRRIHGALNSMDIIINYMST